MNNVCDNAAKAPILRITRETQHESSLTNELTQTIDDLTKQVQLALDKIQKSHNEALEKAKETRRQKMQDIEKHFMNQCSNIEERYNQLMRLEEDVRKRLTIEACQKHITMNSEDNDEAIVIQQMIDSLSQDIWQLRWNLSSKVLKPSTIQTSTLDGEKHAGFSPLFENAAADTLKTKDRWVGGWAEQASLARNAQNANKTQQSQAKKPQKIEPSEKLISLFSSNAAQEDVKDYLKTFFILTQKKSIIPEQIAILVLSFIQSVDKDESKMITSRYIDMIKYWAKKHPDGEFMVIVGIQVFVSSQGHITVDKDAVNILSYLLLFFVQNQCVSNESILKWYQKGTHGRNYVGYPVARHMASKYISETFGI